MNKIPITIWVNIEEPAIENGKIIVKKGNFYYNNQKYVIQNGYILPKMELNNETTETH